MLEGWILTSNTIRYVYIYIQGVQSHWRTVSPSTPACTWLSSQGMFETIFSDLNVSLRDILSSTFTRVVIYPSRTESSLVNERIEQGLQRKYVKKWKEQGSQCQSVSSIVLSEVILNTFWETIQIQCGKEEIRSNWKTNLYELFLLFTIIKRCLT